MTNSEKTKVAAQDKVARLRAEQARTERRRVVIAASAVGAVVVLVAVLVVARLAGGGGPATAASGSSLSSASASAAVTSAVSHVPPATLNTVGAGSANNPPTAITAPALKQGGKPRVLYIGAEYCPTVRPNAGRLHKPSPGSAPGPA